VQLNVTIACMSLLVKCSVTKHAHPRTQQNL
jgi:hypothetical protein